MRVRTRFLSRIPQPWRKAVDWVLTLGVAIAFVLIFEAQVAQPYRIPSGSMEGTLLCAEPGPDCTGSTDDRVLALKLEYDFSSPQRGQIVVFTAPARAAKCAADDGGTTFVKRIVGLPGETVREGRRGFVWIREPHSTRWAKLDERGWNISSASRMADTNHFGKAWRVPEGAYFMMGDNRGGSCDSRTWGAVPRASLIGPVVATYWPLNRIGFP